jgi:hypothetical protein
MTTIEIEYLPQLNEYLEAHSLYDSKTVQRKMDKVIAFSLIVSGIFLFSISLADGFVLVNTILAAVFFAIGILELLGYLDFVKMIMRIRFKNNKKVKHIQKIKFTDQGLEYETEGVKSEIKWNFYTKYHEGENVFILVYGARQYSVIPKHAFNRQLEDFKKLLKKKIIN